MPERRSWQNKRFHFAIARMVAVCTDVKPAFRNISGKTQAQSMTRFRRVFGFRSLLHRAASGMCFSTQGES
jgi:hypothetical protein